MSPTNSEEINRTIAHFLDDVSLCGVKEYTRTNFRIIKLFWSLIIFVGVLATCYYLFHMVRQYRDAPIATKIEFNKTRFYEYPDIVLCPDGWIDTVNFKNLNISPEAVRYGLGHIFLFEKKRFLFEVNETGRAEFERFVETRNFFDYRDFYELIAKPGYRFFDVIDYMKTTLRLNVSKAFLGFQVCYKWNLETLDCAMQTLNRAPTLNVFFDKVLPESESDLNRELPKRGFHSLMINSDLTFANDITPNKIHIAPDQKYVLSIFPKKYFALNKRRHRCMAETAPIAGGRYDRYSQIVCDAYCVNTRYMKIYEKCVSATLFKPYPDWRLENVSFCNSQNNNGQPRDAPEFGRVVSQCADECPPLCDHNLDEITVSGATLVGDQSACDKQEAKPCARQSTLQIQYDVCDKGVMEIREFQSYTFESLVADAGGLLGLWIGISAVTFVQFFLFLLEIALIKFSKPGNVVEDTMKLTRMKMR